MRIVSDYKIASVSHCLFTCLFIAFANLSFLSYSEHSSYRFLLIESS